jgi:putative hydrolase of the HAD superfamily
MGPYEWIFFDLFDTLATVDEELYYEGKRLAAEALGVDPDAFMAAWRGTSSEASLGRLPTPFDRAMKALDGLAIRDRAAAAEVARRDVETIQRCVIYYDGAREALSELRSRGFQLGLISNATATTAFAIAPMHLRDYLDLLVFSYEVGLAKPDPAIFLKALERAACTAERSLFVGDGANGELDAACGLGFDVLCLDHPLKAHSFRNESTLSDPTHRRVSDFAELLALPELSGPIAQA